MGDEFFDRQTGMSNDSPERPSIKLAMIGHHDLGKRPVAPHDDVAALLPDESKPGPLKRGDALAAGDARQGRHTATSIVSNRSSGTGNPSCSSAAT